MSTQIQKCLKLFIYISSCSFYAMKIWDKDDNIMNRKTREIKKNTILISGKNDLESDILTFILEFFFMTLTVFVPM